RALGKRMTRLFVLTLVLAKSLLATTKAAGLVPPEFPLPLALVIAGGTRAAGAGVGRDRGGITAAAAGGLYVVEHLVRGQEAVAVAVHGLEVVHFFLGGDPLVQADLAVLVSVELREPGGQLLRQIGPGVDFRPHIQFGQVHDFVARAFRLVITAL